MEELSDFVFFRVLYEFIHSERDEFAIDLLARTMALVSAAALSALTLWILVRGYRIVTGQSHQPMMGLVVDSLRTTLILGFACGMAVGGSTLYEFLGSHLPYEISRVVTGSEAPIIEQIDRSLAVMQIALGSIDALEVVGDATLEGAKSRALWFTGLGTAGPAMSGGALLLLNQIALSLFIGLGPLFVLCLLFEQTRGLFGRWLYYGIGTMFSLAVLSVMVSIALNMVLAVGATFWLSAPLSGNSEGLTSLAMQQGGLGLILTMLILSVPPMAAQFFNAVLGGFNPFSAFGGGGRNQPQPGSPAYSGSEPDPATAPPALASRHSPFGIQEGHGDEIKRAPEATTDDFRERYPNALASNEWMGNAATPVDAQLYAHAGIGALDHLQTPQRDARAELMAGLNPLFDQPLDPNISDVELRGLARMYAPELAGQVNLNLPLQPVVLVQPEAVCEPTLWNSYCIPSATHNPESLQQLKEINWAGMDMKPNLYVKATDQVGIGIEAASWAAEGVQKVGEAGRLGYGVRFTDVPTLASQYHVASGGKALILNPGVEFYVTKEVVPAAANVMGSSLNWSKAVPVANAAGKALPWIGVAYEATEAVVNEGDSGDWGHVGASTVATVVGVSGVGTAPVLVWFAVDTPVQMYHYTPVFATEYGTEEINGWRAMRATAIDKREYGVRRMMKEHPEYTRDYAEEFFDAKELIRRMELGPK